MPPSYDAKFKNIGQKVGEVEIWRVKKFDLEVVPKEQVILFFFAVVL